MPIAEIESFRFIERDPRGVESVPLPLYSIVPLRRARWLSPRHQQTRATNLARALAQSGSRPHHVGVIGAGLAGLTFAAAYWDLTRNTEVTVFERHPEPLWNLRGCRTRWVHPHFFSWPHRGWHVRQTILPCLNWSAGSAHDVEQQVRKQWDTLVTESGKTLVLKTFASVSSVSLVDDMRFRIAYKHHDTPNPPPPIEVDAVVLAMGPGLESRVPGAVNQTYWHDDCVDRIDPYRIPEPPAHHVIAGAGDGALTDFLRARLSDFVNHSWIDRIPIAATRSDDSVIKKVAQLETAIKQFWEQTEPRKATNASIHSLRKLLNQLERETNWIRDAVKPQRRKETSAEIVAENSLQDDPRPLEQIPCDRDYLLSSTIAPIHRVLVSHVLTLDNADKKGRNQVLPRYGKLNLDGLRSAASAPPSAGHLKGRTWVTITESNGSETLIPAERLVARIGLEWTATAQSQPPDFLDPALRSRLKWPTGSSDDPRWIEVEWTTSNQYRLVVTQGSHRAPTDVRIEGAGPASVLIERLQLQDGALRLSLTEAGEVRVLRPEHLPVVLLSRNLGDRRCALLVRGLPEPPRRGPLDLGTVEGRLAALLGGDLRLLIVVPEEQPFKRSRRDQAISRLLRRWRNHLKSLVEEELIPPEIEAFVADGIEPATHPIKVRQSPLSKSLRCQLQDGRWGT